MWVSVSTPPPERQVSRPTSWQAWECWTPFTVKTSDDCEVSNVTAPPPLTAERCLATILKLPPQVLAQKGMQSNRGISARAAPAADPALEDAVSQQVPAPAPP